MVPKAGLEPARISTVDFESTASTDFATSALKRYAENVVDYGREMFETWYKMAALIQSGLDLSPIITHRFSIDDFQKGFDAMRSGQSGKVILSWD